MRNLVRKAFILCLVMIIFIYTPPIAGIESYAKEKIVINKVENSYNYIDFFSEELAVVAIATKENTLPSKYGFIDKTGKEVIPLVYDTAWSFSEGLAAVEYEGKFGFIDKQGNEVIPFIYSSCRSFSEGMALVTNESKKFGFVDKTGKEVIPLVYDCPGLYDFGFQEGRAMVTKDVNGDGIPDKYGFVDKTGKEVVPLIYERARAFSNGLALVVKDGKTGFIDKDGNITIPLIYDAVAVGINPNEPISNDFISVTQNGKYGYVDRTGKVVIPLIYDTAFEFKYGIAKVIKDGKLMFINETGKQAFINTYGYGIEDCYNGFLRIRQNGKYGFIDKIGKIIISPQFDSSDKGFVENRLVATIDFKSGIIDSTGKVIVPFIYDSLSRYKEGYAKIGVYENGVIKYGFVDLDGNIVIPIIYDYVDVSSNNVAVLHKGSQVYVAVLNISTN